MTRSSARRRNRNAHAIATAFPRALITARLGAAYDEDDARRWVHLYAENRQKMGEPLGLDVVEVHWAYCAELLNRKARARALGAGRAGPSYSVPSAGRDRLGEVMHRSRPDWVLFWTLLVTLIAAIANTIELVRRLP